MIQALVFDFDGVILDTETPLIDAYADVYTAHGLAFDRAAFILAVGAPAYAFDPWAAFPSGGDERERLEREVKQRTRERLARQPVLPGVTTLLAFAESSGWRLGVASNSGRPHVEGLLRQVKLETRFDFLACRGDAPAPKPEPDLYRLVIDHFGLSGREAIAIEDSQSGIRAAKGAGLWCIAVPNPSTHRHNLGDADLVVSSLAELDPGGLAARFGEAET